VYVASSSHAYDANSNSGHDSNIESAT
jgi:hypothetical protein